MCTCIFVCVRIACLQCVCVCQCMCAFVHINKNCMKIIVIQVHNADQQNNNRLSHLKKVYRYRTYIQIQGMLVSDFCNPADSEATNIEFIKYSIM